jgi:hypothetical protein
MSSNLSVVNFTVGGSLTVSGICTLSSVLNSSSNMDIQGMKTSTLEVTGISTFDGSLPTSTQNVVNNDQLTTKIYVDNQDATQKTYIDENVTTINSRIDTNKTDISNNTTNIATNNTNIATNTTNIATNETNIATNTTNISTNTTNISTNSNDISNLKTPASGEIIQTKIFTSRVNGGQVSISSDGSGLVTIFRELFTTVSNNSKVYVDYNSGWGITTYNSVEEWGSFLFAGSTQLSTRISQIGTNVSNNNASLLPIRGFYNNNAKNNNLFIRVDIQARDANTTSNFFTRNENCVITEIQN